MQTRRNFLKLLGALAGSASGSVLAAAGGWKHLLASALYGDLPLAQVLPEVAATGSLGLDIWCKPHGSQREDMDSMGLDTAVALFEKHKVRLVCSTRYGLGPFGLTEEMKMLKRFGGELLVTGARGPKNVVGGEAKAAIQAFLEQLQPHADAAGALGLKLAIENHSDSLLSTPDSIRAWAELNRHPAVGIAFAPHHLHQQIQEMPALIRDLGAANLPFVYLQEYGIGAKQKVEKSVELQQLPGYGTLDYGPIFGALADVGFHGWLEIFMHPTPRGIPVVEGGASAVTKVVRKSREHIDRLIASKKL
jgi:sugar phosphate isomerase/epimerase